MLPRTVSLLGSPWPFQAPGHVTLGHAMEAREAALAAVRADGLELRKVGEFRADKDGQRASWKQPSWMLMDAQHWACISGSGCWNSIMSFRFNTAPSGIAGSCVGCCAAHWHGAVLRIPHAAG